MSDRITADLSGRHPDPARPDLAFRLQTLEIASSTVEHEHEHEHEQVEEHRSPARKKQQQRKREQSSPARLCPPHPQEFEHLSARQKILYSRVKEVCRRVATHPLPVRVLSVTGHGEFFNAGDPIPKRATLVVQGPEDPLVKGLRLAALCSAALSERARRRNEQMVDAVHEALRKDGRAMCTSGTGEDDGSAGKEWWTKLCANKHLTEDTKLKRVRDGEPLGTVADGVEWALLEVIRARNGDASATGSSSRGNDDVKLLVRVARQWAQCLTWSRVAHGSWSHEEITTKLLKHGVPQVDVIVKTIAEPSTSVDTTEKSSAVIAVGTALRAPSEGVEEIPRLGVAAVSSIATYHNANNAGTGSGASHDHCGKGCCSSDDDGGSGRTRGTDHYNRSGFDEDQGVSVWRPDARDVGINLAGVFREEGIAGAARGAAAATAKRLEMLARCYALLRAAVQDLIEGQASISMMEGVNSNAVTEAFLIWLQETVAPRRVHADWARNREAVSQVVGCIALSIEREAKASEAVISWLNNAREQHVVAGFTPPEFLRESFVSEAEFNNLKRAEVQGKKETDAAAVLVYHALYLVLPCQPVKFHFTWGRFMRFYYGMSLYQHIARYYTEVTHRRGSRTWFENSRSHTTQQQRHQGQPPDVSLAASGTNPLTPQHPDSTPGTSTASDHQHGQEGAPLRQPSPPPSRHQVARNLVRARDLEYRPSIRAASWASPTQPLLTAETPTSGHDAQPHRRHQQGNARGEAAQQDPPPALSPMEAAVANECLVSLLAAYGTANRLATGPQVTAALSREGFPEPDKALALLKDANALRGRGVCARLWRGRRGAALIRHRCQHSLFALMPPELFRYMLRFLAS